MDATLDIRFQQFLRERKYLRNVSPQTIEWYETAWGNFKKSATACPTCPADLRQAHLEEFVYTLRDRGVRPVTVNTWLKALNTFFGWLHERGELPTKVRLKPLKVEKRLVPTIDADAIRAIVTYKPPTWVTVNKKHINGPRKGQKAFALWRVHALVCTLLDTGCRIDELLTALTTSFEQDDLLLTVIGKGDKQRRVPFSVELRGVLFRYLQTRERLGINDALMFPCDGGGQWNQRNALRSLYVFQKRLGLKQVGFRRLRHTFATEYLRNGGDVCGCLARWAIRRSPPPCATSRCSPAIFKSHMGDVVRWRECGCDWSCWKVAVSAVSLTATPVHYGLSVVCEIDGPSVWK